MSSTWSICTFQCEADCADFTLSFLSLFFCFEKGEATPQNNNKGKNAQIKEIPSEKIKQGIPNKKERKDKVTSCHGLLSCFNLRDISGSKKLSVRWPTLATQLQICPERQKLTNQLSEVPRRPLVRLFGSGTEKVPQRTSATKILPNFRVNFLARFASKPLFYWVVPSNCSENYLVLFVRFFDFGVLFLAPDWGLLTS